ncbi:RNA-binding domain-containing protein [Microlunatus parietis]|uniref:ATP-dependent DNA helicase RecG n=1 Tax=Microlunatus parietis TaxID=682979 RepID=A0A7Y9I911_9ACTN|nr:RNA-binding domain-containing protein [Microlunatus parietis]NYE72171.1 ATP-dependent DNA helicase RecG [Microlunatus parietis]
MADIEDVLHAIERRQTSAGMAETQVLDFKTEKPNPKETFQDLAEASVCFANAGGGSIVVGVRDVGTGTDAFVGTDLDLHQLRSRIYDLTEPHLTVAIRELIWAGKRLVEIQVPEGLDVYSTGKGLFLRRWTDQCRPMRPADVARLSDDRNGIDWSAQPSGRPIDDVDPQAMQQLRVLLRSSGETAKEQLARLADHELLRELRLALPDDLLTRTADYLLCPPSGSTAHDLIVYQHRQTASGEADQVRRWQPPMLTAFTESMAVIAARIGVTPVNTARGQQLAIEDYPTAAVREGLANALIHGDLRERRAIQIEHSPEALTVRSPGPLVSGITPQNILTHGSRARFPLLAATMRVLGLAEELGQGVDRMYREMVRSGRTVPRVHVDEGQTTETVVDFRGGPPNVRLARFVADLPEAEQRDTDALLITLLLCQKRSVTAKDVSTAIQRDPREAEGVLRRLAHGDAKILEPTAGTVNRRQPNYRFTGAALAALGPAVAYSRRTASETDRKVIDHLRDYGTINNSTLQRIFDVDVYQARDLLRDLVGRELLVRVSEQTRGVAVRYGPGPKFPQKGRRRTAVKSTDDAAPAFFDE